MPQASTSPKAVVRKTLECIQVHFWLAANLKEGRLRQFCDRQIEFQKIRGHFALKLQFVLLSQRHFLLAKQQKMSLFCQDQSRSDAYHYQGRKWLLCRLYLWHDVKSSRNILLTFPPPVDVSALNSQNAANAIIYQQFKN